jgi:hypothetical protein
MKKKISQKELKRRKEQSDLARYGQPLYTPEGDLTAKPVKGGYKLEKR